MRPSLSPQKPLVLVFVGQDNEAVGGTQKWSNGYIDHFGVPAGITHYVYFAEGKRNDFGFSFDKGHVDGLNKETTWGSGPMCLRCYVESKHLDGTIIHLSISMEFDDEEDIAKGVYDNNIDELASFLKEFSHIPFLIRIGYEFDGPWNNYKPQPFKNAWRRIVDHLHDKGIANFATVMASSSVATDKQAWLDFWPGDKYVDWIGYSYWSYPSRENIALDLAREKNLPVFIAEAAPRGLFLNKLTGMTWWDWYSGFFDHIEQNQDVIRAISYINANWDKQPMWQGRGWGNSQLQDSKGIADHWKNKMKDKRYLHSPKGTYDRINFKANN